MIFTILKLVNMQRNSGSQTYTRRRNAGTGNVPALNMPNPGHSYKVGESHGLSIRVPKECYRYFHLPS